MFRASSSDVSEFTDVAVSFVNTLTEQATETFPNQKPWMDRTIRDAVNKRTAAYNEALLSGNMSEYKASCYALRRAVRATKFRYSERIESHFQLNDSRRMWQGLMLRSSPPRTFVLTSRQVVITTSGAFKSLWSEQDGDLTFLHKIQFFLTLHL